MEELIKEAEMLYKQIDEIQLDLVKSRLDVCEERKWKAISDMETAMCGTQQFLKCIIERKDNIVNLGEVWHDTDEEPKEGWIIGQNKYEEFDIFVMELEDVLPKSWFNTNTIGRWAYLFDLLPKGDSK